MDIGAAEMLGKGREDGMNENKPDKFYFTVGQLAEVLKTLPPDFPVLGQRLWKRLWEFLSTDCCQDEATNRKTHINDGEFLVAQKGDRETFDAVVLARGGAGWLMENVWTRFIGLQDG